MNDLWPEVPTYYAEIVYDMCKNESQEKIDEIKEKVEKVPFKYSKKNKLEN